ncbi:transmembrane protein FAM155A-like [Argonauta hians]
MILLLLFNHGEVSPFWAKTPIPTIIVQRRRKRWFSQYLSTLILCAVSGFVSGLSPAENNGVDYLTPTCTPNQCLLEGWNITKEICNLSATERRIKMRETRLRFCSLYTLDSVLSDEVKNTQGDYEQCVSNLDRIKNLDESVCKNNSLFLNIVNKYDCKEHYSVLWNCTNCVKAYREWLCAVYIPFYVEGVLVKPCNAFCSKVEETCPFFRPAIKETYAGDPSFICKDPFITSHKNYIDILPDGDRSYEDSNVSQDCYERCHLESQLAASQSTIGCDSIPSPNNTICRELQLYSNHSLTSSGSSQHFLTFKSTCSFWCNLVKYVHIFWLSQTLYKNLSAGLT